MNFHLCKSRRGSNPEVTVAGTTPACPGGETSACPEDMPSGNTSPVPVDTNSAPFSLQICPTTGGMFYMEVTGSGTIDGLRRTISKKLGVAQDRISLLYRDKILKDGTMKDNELSEGSKITLLPHVESGLMSPQPDMTVMQALENLSENQVNDFLCGKSPLTLAMRLGSHVMFLQLQLSTATPGCNKRTPGLSSKPLHMRGHHPYRQHILHRQRRTDPQVQSSPLAGQAPVAGGLRVPPAQVPTQTPGSPLGRVPSPIPKTLPGSPQRLTPPRQSPPNTLSVPLSSMMTTPRPSYSDSHGNLCIPPAFQTSIMTPPPSPKSPSLSPSPTSGTSYTYPMTALNLGPMASLPKDLEPSSLNTPPPSPCYVKQQLPQLSPSPLSEKQQVPQLPLSPPYEPQTPLSPPSPPCDKPSVPQLQVNGEELDSGHPNNFGEILKQQTPPPMQSNNQQTFNPTLTPPHNIKSSGSSDPGQPRLVRPIPSTPLVDRSTLAEAKRNLSMRLKEFSEQATTEKAPETTKPGAVIESMHKVGQGVYSGTFSGTLNPALQDTDGKPKKSINTIVHILNDLLGATPPSVGHPHRTQRMSGANNQPAGYPRPGNNPQGGTPVSAGCPQVPKDSRTATTSMGYLQHLHKAREVTPMPQVPQDTKLIGTTYNLIQDDKANPHSEKDAIREKVEHIQKLLEERKRKRQSRRGTAPYQIPRRLQPCDRSHDHNSDHAAPCGIDEEAQDVNMRLDEEEYSGGAFTLG